MPAISSQPRRLRTATKFDAYSKCTLEKQNVKGWSEIVLLDGEEKPCSSALLRSTQTDMKRGEDASSLD